MDRIIVPDAESLAHLAAEMVQAEITSSDSTLLGLSGGATPGATHEVLTKLDIDWSHVVTWVSDERWVGPDSDESNQHMVRETLTDQVDVPLMAPNTTRSTPSSTAHAFADQIVPAMMDARARSVTMLGVGPDGHTASLFPGTKAVDNESISYVANFVPVLDAWRLTATFGLLGESDVALFIVTGEAKASVMAEIASGVDYPATRVTARDRVVWLLDEAAASEL
jgi:6-phosphogluconolactonase